MTAFNSGQSTPPPIPRSPSSARCQNKTDSTADAFAKGLLAVAGLNVLPIASTLNRLWVERPCSRGSGSMSVAQKRTRHAHSCPVCGCLPFSRTSNDSRMRGKRGTSSPFGSRRTSQTDITCLQDSPGIPLYCILSRTSREGVTVV